MSIDTCLSLQEIMGECYNTSLQLAYKTKTERGTMFDARDEGDLTEEEADLVYGWADGLVHQYYHKRATGQCSLQASMDFDVGKFEEQCLKELAIMKEILTRVTPCVVVTDKELRARGYKV